MTVMGVDSRVALLVEADPVQRDLIRLALSRLGLQVTVTTDGDRVVGMVEALHPAILVIDAFLPNRNGLEILRQLRDLGRLEETGVIFISGLGFREVVQQAVDAGAEVFLVKPVDTDLLVERARQMLAERVKR
ncbi:MAG TPA: response regulator [Anaerolineaceae bacterium]|nr:response regulator [Anaerolineaceae bacterium]